MLPQKKSSNIVRTLNDTHQVTNINKRKERIHWREEKNQQRNRKNEMIHSFFFLLSSSIQRVLSVLIITEKYVTGLIHRFCISLLPFFLFYSSFRLVKKALPKKNRNEKKNGEKNTRLMNKNKSLESNFEIIFFYSRMVSTVTS